VAWSCGVASPGLRHVEEVEGGGGSSSVTRGMLLAGNNLPTMSTGGWRGSTMIPTRIGGQGSLTDGPHCSTGRRSQKRFEPFQNLNVQMNSNSSKL
jgi:hypothetical protein